MHCLDPLPWKMGKLFCFCDYEISKFLFIEFYLVLVWNHGGNMILLKFQNVAYDKIAITL
jgi:hypothetical protein